MKQYTAPWGTMLKVISAITPVILLGVPITVFLAIKNIPTGILYVFLIFPTILFLSSFFVVRSFELDKYNKTLLIQRLFWKTTLSLEGLQEVRAEKDLLSGSLRLFGNGGLFAFTGKWWSKKLGMYSIFANDLEKCILLKTKHNTWVVAPGETDSFLENVRELIKDAKEEVS